MVGRVERTCVPLELELLPLYREPRAPRPPRPGRGRRRHRLTGWLRSRFIRSGRG